MQPALRQRILHVSEANAIAGVELIQPLWNNYGSLCRVRLNGGKWPSVILKHIQIPAQLKHPRGFASSLSQQRKVQSYKVETHWYQNQNHALSAKSPTPKCLAVFEMGEEVALVLEDLSTLGFMPSQYSADWTQIAQVLAWLAHFHGQCMALSSDGLWPIGTYWHLATRPEELARIQGTPEHAFAGLIDARLQHCRFQTLVHGDAKLANFCFASDHTGVAAVDFQYVGRGCGMKDVAYFAGSCLSEADCRRLEPLILETYFSELRACLAETNVDIRALEAEWRELYPIAWADFQRFMLGWSPTHRKLTPYSDALTQQAIEAIGEDLLSAAKTACLSAGRFIESHRHMPLEIRSKGLASEASDMVTEIDVNAQAMIIDALTPSMQRYGLGLLAEEGSPDDSRLHKHAFWAIDPLDGTQRYVNGKSGYATSIALVSQTGQTLLAAVYDPANQRFYHAVKGGGFFVDGQLHRPTAEKSSSAPLTWHADNSLKTHPHFSHYQTHFDLQFIGGAVMNVIGLIFKPKSCYVKAPKATLGGCAIWDLAAVTLMLEECGGSARCYDGAPVNLNRPESIYFNDVGLCYLSSDLSHAETLRQIENAANSAP